MHFAVGVGIITTKLTGTALRCGFQADALLWVHTPNIPGLVAGKFLGDLKGAFFKKPPFRVSLWRFLFASFSFVPTCSKEKEELWNLIE